MTRDGNGINQEITKSFLLRSQSGCKLDENPCRSLSNLCRLILSISIHCHCLPSFVPYCFLTTNQSTILSYPKKRAKFQVHDFSLLSSSFFIQSHKIHSVAKVHFTLHLLVNEMSHPSPDLNYSFNHLTTEARIPTP